MKHYRVCLHMTKNYLENNEKRFESGLPHQKGSIQKNFISEVSKSGIIMSGSINH